MAQALGYTVDRIGQMVARLPAFISYIRGTGVRVIWTRFVEDPAYMAANAVAKISSFAQPLVLCSPGTSGFEYFEVSPYVEDVQVIKNTYGAFSSDAEHLRQRGIATSDLEQVLRLSSINSLIFAGVLTSRCVGTTLREVFGRGYHCIAAEHGVCTRPTVVRA